MQELTKKIILVRLTSNVNWTETSEKLSKVVEYSHDDEMGRSFPESCQ